MSWFDRFFRKQPKTSHYAAMLNGYIPIFGQYGTSIYASDVVQQALKCIVDEMKKLSPTHVRMNGADAIPVKGDIQNVLENPNPLMTTSDFIEKVTWLLLLNYNAFIIPTYYVWRDEKTGEERRRYEALYPIKPIQVDFLEDASGKLYTKFYFQGGKTTTVPYDDVIHIKYNYSVNEYMGGNELGAPDTEHIVGTVELNRRLLEGIAKAMDASYAVNGVVKYNTMFDEDKALAAIQELEDKLRRSESGFLPLDLKAEFIPITRNTQLVDENLVKFVDEKILRNWGVSLPILTGDFTKEQYEAFFQKAIESLIVSMNQAFTKTIFSQRAKAFGNRIEFYPKRLIFMTTSQKIELIKELAPTGALYENEKRVMFGLAPLEELEGKRYMSLNWINAQDASEYQIGKDADVNVDIVDKEDM